MPVDPLHLIAFAVAGILVCLLGLSLGYEIRRFIWRKKKEQVTSKNQAILTHKLKLVEQTVKRRQKKMTIT